MDKRKGTATVPLDALETACEVLRQAYNAGLIKGPQRRGVKKALEALDDGVFEGTCSELEDGATDDAFYGWPRG